jgi:A/G-specific adenine glycosylase
MLQQTQTDRVRPKYLAFLEAFPKPAALATASVESLLALWTGLGYNRRALNLKRAAAEIVERFGGRVPEDEEALLSLPGLGPYTSRAVLAFAFGRPTAFIETNIRSVFLYHFFPVGEAIPDALLLPLVEAALDPGDPRVWYQALMDYGVFLKKSYGNPNARSRQYAKQSPFASSHRRIRGAALREIGRAGSLESEELAALLPFSRERVEEALVELAAEGFIEYRAGRLAVKGGA